MYQEIHPSRAIMIIMITKDNSLQRNLYIVGATLGLALVIRCPSFYFGNFESDDDYKHFQDGFYDDHKDV